MKKTSSILLLMATVATPVWASFSGVLDPTGWEREASGTAFAQWDSFTSAGGGEVGSTDGGFASFNLTSSAFSQANAPGSSGFAPAAFLIGGPAPLDNRLYSGGDSVDFSVSGELDDDMTVLFATLQIRETHTEAPTGFDGILLDGIAPASETALADGEMGTVWHYTWTPDQLGDGLTDSFLFTFGKTAFSPAGTHISLDSVTVDLAAIPEPSVTAVLLGMGVLLLAIRRRR